MSEEHNGFRIGSATYNVERLTPETAKRWLESSPGNRPTKRLHVANLAEEMRQGRWNVNGGSPFKFDEMNRLVDGHNRCLAVIQSGMEIDVLVARGVENARPPEIHVSPWSTADSFNASGQRNANSFAAAATRVLGLRAIEEGQCTSMPRSSSKVRTVQMFAGDVALDYWVNYCAGFKRNHFALSASELAGFIYYVHADPSIVSEAAREFVDKMIDGENLTRKDPVFMLRSRLRSRDLSAPQMLTAKFMVLAKAWNAFISETPMGVLRANPDEAMPTILKV